MVISILTKRFMTMLLGKNLLVQTNNSWQYFRIFLSSQQKLTIEEMLTGRSLMIFNIHLILQQYGQL